MRRGFVVLWCLAAALTACSVKAVTYTPEASPDAAPDGPPVVPVCGNGKVETGEQCDDGNTINGDECSSTCQNVDCTVSLVPTMTDLTAPSGEVIRSGALDGQDDEAWHAFDRNTSTQWISALDQTPAWIGYQWGDGPRKVKSYSILFINGSLTTRAPRDWTFEGWDGANWIVLDTQTNQINWAGFEKRTFTIPSPGVFSMYRLDATEDNDPRPEAPIVVISIGELDLVGCPR